MDIYEKLKILTEAAKYDVACTSSGVNRRAGQAGMGSTAACGICHSFSGDGRCISLLKVLLTNRCIYNCHYCLNRRSNILKRTEFTPRELAELTLRFYRLNYIEGLFVSSGVWKNPDYTMEQLIETLRILRHEYRFSGYIHAKAIPGADPALVRQLGLLADRMSVNLELPSAKSLALLAPDKPKQSIFTPMRQIQTGIFANRQELVRYRHTPRFVPAGQSTQMIVGATGENDYEILRLTENLYKRYQLKRVFFSAYIPVAEHAFLPALDVKPPLLREHRLYQADWLLRYYGFFAEEILDRDTPYLHPYIDPKCYWALRHMEFFPLEVNRASYQDLLRAPGIGVYGAKRIVIARKNGRVDFDALKKLGIVLKRAQYFVTCGGKKRESLVVRKRELIEALTSERMFKAHRQELLGGVQQTSLFEEVKEECLRLLP